MKIKEIAILGPTASGKTAAAIEIAQKYNADILSLDSLAIYKETDIVSAKPTLHERGGIRHFGIDVLNIDDYFSAATFFDLYHEARRESEREGKHLIIVGGTSFYLKSMMQGLSPKVTLSKDSEKQLHEILHNLHEAYETIADLDSLYARKIASNDRYRIQKWHEIYLETGLSATAFFTQNRRTPVLADIPIFEITVDRDTLRKRITARTAAMLEAGVIEEVFALEKRYSRAPAPMKAIGIKETLDYLDGKLTLDQLHEQISTHTAQLAKRQQTFNSSQFPNRTSMLLDDLILNIGNFFN
ncbi:MAG: tRNA (adenosine(37)-N6)-dimethylallyltransferase MiaA [Sulfurospirillum sp.]|nr:MAG: tRNA (adenosine(37)-N6)-dimethylallyltransferase MiaA [Sulfurospirillum sp.]